MIREYRLRHATVDAVRWERTPPTSVIGAGEDNLQEILVFAGNHVKMVTDLGIFFSLDGSVRILTHGDWAVKNPHTGMVYAMTDKEFHETYVE